MSTATAEPAEGDIPVQVYLPRHQVEWLDIEAVKRKHMNKAGKAAKSPIVIELIERAMSPKKAKAEK